MGADVEKTARPVSARTRHRYTRGHEGDTPNKNKSLFHDVLCYRQKTGRVNEMERLFVSFGFAPPDKDFNDISWMHTQLVRNLSNRLVGRRFHALLWKPGQGCLNIKGFLLADLLERHPPKTATTALALPLFSRALGGKNIFEKGIGGNVVGYGYLTKRRRTLRVGKRNLIHKLRSYGL